ncbi:MAG: polymerase subunit delta [Actinomycetota bacterium]|nr:polymerase subunit delta [Actinomycetota bacterium]
MTKTELPVVPAYLIKGDDPSLAADAVREVVGFAVGDDDPNLAVEDLGADGENGPSAAVEACLTPSMLAARRVVVLRDVGRFRTDEVEPLLAYLGEPSADAVIVLVAGGGQTPPKLLNAVKKVGHVVDASVPSSAKARTSWLVDKLKDAPVTLDAAAGKLIGDHLGEDVGRLSSLLDALATTYGPDAKVGTAEVEPFLGEAGGVAPWDLTDAIDRGETEAALILLHRMTGAGERHPLVIMATLHRHFQAMLRLDGSGVSSESQAASMLGMAPYPAKKALTQARRLGSDGIGQAIVLLAQCDLDLRGASESPDDLILEVLVARLCRLARAGSRPSARSGARR